MTVLVIMVFRRRQSNYLRPINTMKHVVDAQRGVGLGVRDIVLLIDGTPNPVLANVEDCEPGSHVKSFFLNVQVAASSTAALANIYFIAYKNPGNNVTVAGIPDANAVGSSDFKRNVFHQEMIMTEKNTTAIARTMFRGVIRIPRHMQRIGQDDTINLQFFSPGVNFDVCTQCIYKEIR